MICHIHLISLSNGRRDGRATDTDKRSARERDTWYPDCPVTDWPMQRVSNTIGFTSRWIIIPQSGAFCNFIQPLLNASQSQTKSLMNYGGGRKRAAERRVIIPVQFLFDLPAGKEGFRPIKMTAFVLPCPPVWYFDEGERDRRATL